MSSGCSGLLMILWVLPAKNVILMMPFCLQDLPLVLSEQVERKVEGKEAEGKLCAANPSHIDASH